MFYIYVGLCTSRVCRTLRGQRTASDALEPELHTVVSHHMGAGDWIRVLWKSRLRSSPLVPEGWGRSIYVADSVPGEVVSPGTGEVGTLRLCSCGAAFTHTGGGLCPG